MTKIDDKIQKAWCEYRNMEYVEGCVRPLPSENFERGYEYGKRDALAEQWCRGDETPARRLCITKSKNLDNRNETRFCEWDGENFIDLYDYSVIRPYAYLSIPELSKDESK